MTARAIVFRLGEVFGHCQVCTLSGHRRIAAEGLRYVRAIFEDRAPEMAIRGRLLVGELVGALAVDVNVDEDARDARDHRSGNA